MTSGTWDQRQVALQHVIDRFVVVSVATQAKGQPGLRIYDTDTEGYLSSSSFKTSWDHAEVLDANGTSMGVVGKLVTGELAEKHGIRRVLDVTFSFADPPLTVITAANGDRLFNTFRGFDAALTGDAPVPAESAALVQFLKDSVCGGDKYAYGYIVKWLAWCVQNPADKPGVAVALIGSTGTGKSTFSMLARQLFEPYSIGLSRASQVFGQFTGHLAQMRMIGLEEALWAKDGQSADNAKDAITAAETTIEAKGKDARRVRTAWGFIITTNHAHGVPAIDGERRYMVLRMDGVTGWQKGDANWGLILQGGGKVKTSLVCWLYASLKKIDLNAWHPRQNVPQTAALAQQKLETGATGVDGWLRSLLAVGAPASGPFNSSPWEDWDTRPVTLDKAALDTLHQSATFWRDANVPVIDRRSGWSRDSVVKALSRIGGKAWRTSTARGWTVPALPDAKAAYAATLGITVQQLEDSFS